MQKHWQHCLLSLLACLLLALLCGPPAAHAAVMSIDYGTEWFKVGLIKPGVPLDVALNRDSKRKTQSVITIRGEERFYGSDSVNLGTRFPQNTYYNLKSLLGRHYDDRQSQEYRSRFVNSMVKDPQRGTISFRNNETIVFAVEELVAFQFAHAKEQAEATAQETVRDVVITVPPYFNQFERQAVLDAAELAGLKVLSLIHDETAVALNYAMNRKFTTEPQYHIFYDMGAGSTVASLISFSNTIFKEGKRNKTLPQIEVLAVGYDRTLGGYEFDLRLQRRLGEAFEEQKKGQLKQSVFESDKAMAKLLKEANRVKQILSANQDTLSSIEGLHEELDFKTKVTRAELESMSKDLLDRIRGPIDTVLKTAKMKVSDIQSLVLVGGSVRIPAVQTILKEIVGEDKIAQNVNGDEAAVLGAAFRGAGMSHQFRLTQEIRIKDVTPFAIEVDYSSEPKLDEETQKVYHTTLFGEFAPVGARKIMNFKRTTDFDFELKYGKLSEEDRALGLADLAKVTVTGLTDITAKLKDPNAERSKVRVAIELSESGILSVTEATATVEAKEPEDKPTLADKVKSFFGAGSSADDHTVSDESLPSSQETPALNASEQIKTDNSNTTQVNDTPAASEKEVKLEKIQLAIKVIPLGIKPMEAAEKAPAAARLQSMDAKDRKRRAREEARNNVESFVYRTQDWLYDDTVQLVSTEDQREQLRERLSETSEWLYGDGEQALTEEYVAKLKDLEKLQKPIDFRRSENTKRPEAIKALQGSISTCRTFLELIRQNTTDEDRYHTEEELDRLEQLCDDSEDWLAARLREQEALKSYADPILTSVDIEARQRAVDREAMALLMRKPPKKEKKKKTEKKAKGEEEEKAEEESEEGKSEEGKREEGKSEKPEEKAGDKEERAEKPADKPFRRDEL